MIPRPLVEPFPVRTERAPRRIGLVIGVGLCALSIIGLFVWLSLTPFGFSRFSQRDGDLVQDIGEPGTYLVFEERSGAAVPALPPPLTVAVTSKGGDVIQVEQLVPPNTIAAPLSYKTPFQEGRAIARFTVDQPGLYHIRTAPLRRGAPLAGYGPRLISSFAVGSERSTTWIASWWGSLVFFVLPLVLGVTTIVVASRRLRRRTATRSVPQTRSTSLTRHG